MNAATNVPNPSTNTPQKGPHQMTTLPHDEPVDHAAWWRRPCWVTTQLIVTGDLHPDRTLAAAQLQHWADLGVTHIADVREEWSDETFVSQLQPAMTYLHLPTHDNGGHQDDNWFSTSVSHITDIIRASDTNVVVLHCHMGVNRAPSLALAVLLELGWSVTGALSAIREARPIAGILYAEQAVDWSARHRGLPDEIRRRDREAARRWLAEHPVNVAWIISRIRRAERSAHHYATHRKNHVNPPGLGTADGTYGVAV